MIKTKTQVGTKVGIAFIAAAGIVAAYAITMTTFKDYSGGTTLSTNQTSAVLTVAKPNLRLTNLDAADASGKFPNLAISFVVSNTGTANATWKASQEYLSYEWLDANGTLLGTKFTDVTKAAYTSAVGAKLGVTNDLLSSEVKGWITNRPSKAMRLRVTVDPANVIGESDETDNTITVPVPLPDLVVRDVSVVRPTTGSSLYQLTYTIRNLGTAPAVWTTGQNLFSLEWVDPFGAVRGTRYNEVMTKQYVIPAGAVYAVSSDLVSASAKAWLANPVRDASKLKMTVDPDNVLFEASENFKSATVDVPLADLTLTDAVATLNGAQLNLSFRMNNVGTAPATWATGQKILSLQWYAAGTTTVGTTYEMVATKQYVIDKGATVGMLQELLPADMKAWLANRPAGAIRMRLAINPAFTLSESNPSNNSMLIRLP